MRILKSLFIMSAIFSLLACGDYPHVNTLELNREGNRLLVAQNAQGALDKYLEALRFNPFHAALHLNIGLSFEFLQQPDKARQSYQEAERLAEINKDLETQFMARFNQAQLLGKEKKVDPALAMYQKALEILPSSNEAKVNIELLTQQQKGGGEGEGEQKDQENKDQKNDQQKKQDGKDKEDKDKKDDKDGKKDKPKQMQGSPKYKPRPFDGKELSEGDVKKILGELKQQEEKIRAEFNRKDVKEQPRDKDW